MEYNALIVNGVSTASFDFKVYVQHNDGFRLPKKKNRLIETEYTTGAIKDNIKAYPPIEKEYTLFCMTKDLKDLRKIKAWAKDYGELIAADEPDVFYEIVDVKIGHSRMDTLPGYQLEVTFTVQPFGFEIGQNSVTYYDGHVIANHTNAPMYPKVTIYGTSNVQTSVRIGDQTIYIEKLIDKLTIECKYLEQNVFDRNNAKANGVMRGPFFEIPEGTNTVTLGEGITHIEVLERWGWL